MLNEQTWWSQSSLNPYKWVRERDEKALKSVARGENVGTYVDFITWNLIVRPTASIVSGLFAATLFYSIDWVLGANLIDFWLWLALVALVAFIVGYGEKKTEVVPEGKMAMVSWFGIPLRVYRQTGEYAWTGEKFRFGRVKVLKEPMTDKDGFFYTDVVQTNIWNVYESDPKKRSNVLVAVTKTSSEIRANLLLMFRMRDPMLWVKKIDPMMDIGERARMSFRTVVSFFTGKDIVSVKNLLTEMMSGNVVLTCFMKDPFETLVRYSLIRDRGGDPMYESVRPDEKLESEIGRFQERLQKEANRKMLQVIEKVDDNYLVEQREVSESLHEVLHACGVTLERASVGYISLPDEVTRSANQADAQPYQLATQIASAQAAKAARDLLRPEEVDRNDPTFADRQAFAASSDPDSRIEVIHVSGGGNGGDGLGIKQAAAVLANAIKNGDKKK